MAHYMIRTIVVLMVVTSVHAATTDSTSMPSISQRPLNVVCTVTAGDPDGTDAFPTRATAGPYTDRVRAWYTWLTAADATIMCPDGYTLARIVNPHTDYISDLYGICVPIKINCSWVPP